jgi:hypothetical protein
VISGLTSNYSAYREHSLQRINNLFLAIKFKVRFKNNFCKNFGYVQEERFRKYLMRHLTILAPCFYENRCDKAMKIIHETLKKNEFIRAFKRNTRKTMDCFHKI